MKKKVIKLIEKHVKKRYKNSCQLLLQQESYQKEVDIKNVKQYFTFLESSLKKPYNRLIALATFLDKESGLFLSSQAYPFALLKAEVKQTIKDWRREAVQLATGLDVSGIDPDYFSLDQEKFLKDLVISEE